MANRQQLVQAQPSSLAVKLEAALAHDLRNVFALIRANAEMLSLELPGDDKRQKRLLDIMRFADRGSALTGEWLSASSRRDDAG